MKKLDVGKLTPDPLAEAIAEANYETAVISGYIRNTDRETISICKNRMDKSSIEFPLKSVVAAFNFDEKSTKIIFLIKKDTEVRSIKYTTIKGIDCNCSGENGSGYSERIQLPPELRFIGGQKVVVVPSPELVCASEHHSCIIGGLGTDLCENLRKECLLGL